MVYSRFNNVPYKVWCQVTVQTIVLYFITFPRCTLQYLIGVSSVLVLGPVWSIREGLVTAFMFTHVWFLSSVRAQVGLQILQARVGFITALELKQKDTERFYNNSQVPIKSRTSKSQMKTDIETERKKVHRLRLKIHSQCTYVASLLCVCAYEPPACTGLWKASVLESIPASDTQTPSFLHGCAHCWCAVK